MLQKHFIKQAVLKTNIYITPRFAGVYPREIEAHEWYGLNLRKD